MDLPCCPQHLLELWVWGCLAVGSVLLLGGARAAGAALVGSSVLAVFAFLLKGLYGGDHLETLVHGAVIAASVGLVGFGLAGLAFGADHPLGRFPVALALAIGTVVVGRLYILQIQAAVAPGVALVQRGLSRAVVPGGGVEGIPVIEDARTGRRPVGLATGSLRSWRVAIPVRCHRSGVTPGLRRQLWAIFGAASILIAACTSTPTGTLSDPTTPCFDTAKVEGLHDEWEDAYRPIANLSDRMNTDQVVASVRATREIALELAIATAADPVAAGHFEDAADVYLNAPPIPPHVSLEAMSRSDMDRLQRPIRASGDAMYAGIVALNYSTIPFC
jgi:hypothetical protein